MEAPLPAAKAAPLAGGGGGGSLPPGPPPTSSPNVWTPPGQPPDPAKFGATGGPGRPRADGLAPGSPAAVAADKERNRLRMAEVRAKGRANRPPLAPVAVPGGSGAPEAPLPGVVSQPGAVADAPGAQAPAVLWRGSDLARTAGLLFSLREQTKIKALTSKAAEVGLPPKLLRELEDEARTDETIRKEIAAAGGEVAAKYANKAGLPADAAPELNLLTLLAISEARWLSIASKLDKAIAAKAEAEAEARKPKPAT